MNAYTRQDLSVMQAWPLKRKIRVTQAKIIEWYHHYGGKVAVSFSGGKDSTVLLDLARRAFPDIPAVFVDTGLEYPEIREFVKTVPNVTWLRPEMPFSKVINSASGLIVGNTSINLADHIADLEARLLEMNVWTLLGLWLQSFVVGFTMWGLTICIFIIIYGRMIEIYLVTSIAPIPMATMMGKEWGGMGQNYLRSLLALAFQGFLIIICIAIYAVLVQNMLIDDNISTAIWLCMGYTVLLCFTLFKTSSLAKSIFNSH